MVVVELRFITGRYHATPWGRNVNEGAVEWPPSPYRLARALVDVGKRKFSDWTDDRIEAVVRYLAGSPRISLPQASSGHTRSFLSSNREDSTNKQKIFDAFTTVVTNSTVYLGFECSLTPSEKDDLDTLLRNLDYLGRSESWVEGRLLEEEAAEEMVWNCLPSQDETNGFSKQETVQVACLYPLENYNALDQKPVSTIWHGKNKNVCSWFESLCMATEDLRQQGWSDPPVLMWSTYQRPKLGTYAASTKKTKLRSQFNWARFELTSTVLPRIEETLPIAERVRSHLMGINKRLNGGNDEAVSTIFSGKEKDGHPLHGHSHAFYLPVDEDGDGWIDHLIVKTSDPFSDDEMLSLDRLRSIWQSKGKPDIQFTLVELSRTKGRTSSRKWVSTTPFVTKRHYRKGRGSFTEWLENEIKRECSFQRLPKPLTVNVIEKTVQSTQAMPWWAFTRNRKGREPMKGFGFTLEFEEDIKGPFALGALCHFGLGLFLPLQ